MKHKHISRLALLSAFIVVSTIPQYIPPAIEAETLTIPIGRGKGIEVTR